MFALAQSLAARRQAELVEAFWRISTGIEALYQQGERQGERRLKAATALEAKVEGALKYFIEAWQAVRPRPGAKARRRPERNQGSFSDE